MKAFQFKFIFFFLFISYLSSCQNDNDCVIGLPENDYKDNIEEVQSLLVVGEYVAWTKQNFDKKGRLLKEVMSDDNIYGMLSNKRRERLNLPKFGLGSKVSDEKVTTKHFYYDSIGRTEKMVVKLNETPIAEVSFDYSLPNVVQKQTIEFGKKDSIKLTSTFYENCKKDKMEIRSGQDLDLTWVYQYRSENDADLFFNRDGKLRKTGRDIKNEDHSFVVIKFDKDGKETRQEWKVEKSLYDSFGNTIFRRHLLKTKADKTSERLQLFDYSYYDKSTANSQDLEAFGDLFLRAIKENDVHTLTHQVFGNLEDYIEMYIRLKGYAATAGKFNEGYVNTIHKYQLAEVYDLKEKWKLDFSKLAIKEISLDRKLWGDNVEFNYSNIIFTDGVQAKRFKRYICMKLKSGYKLLWIK